MKSRLVQPLYKRGFSVVLLDLPGSGGSGLNTNTQVDGGCVFSAETTGSSLQYWDVIMKTWKWTIQDQDLKVLKCGEPFLRTFLRIILRRNLEATVNYPKMVGQVPLSGNIRFSELKMILNLEIQVPYEDWEEEDFRIVENALRVLASRKTPWLFPHESWQTGRDPPFLHPIWWGMQHHDNRLVKSRSIGSFFATHCGLGSHEQVYWDMSPRRLWHVTYTADLTIDLPWKKPGKMIFLLDMAMYGFHVINLGAVNAGECCRTS